MSETMHPRFGSFEWFVGLSWNRPTRFKLADDPSV